MTGTIKAAPDGPERRLLVWAQRHALLLAFLLALPWPAFAQDPGDEWRALNKEILELSRAEQHDRAATVAQRALEVAKKNPSKDHLSIATSQFILASIYQKQGNYARAEPLYLDAITGFEKALGADHPHVASSLNDLGNLYKLQGASAKAEPLYLRALAIRERTLGPNHQGCGHHPQQSWPALR